MALLAVALSLLSSLALVAFIRQQAHDDAIEALHRDTVEQADALAAVVAAAGMAALAAAIAHARPPTMDRW